MIGHPRPTPAAHLARLAQAEPEGDVFRRSGWDNCDRARSPAADRVPLEGACNRCTCTEHALLEVVDGLNIHVRLERKAAGREVLGVHAHGVIIQARDCIQQELHCVLPD